MLYIINTLLIRGYIMRKKKQKTSLLQIFIFVCFWWVFLIIYLMKNNKREQKQTATYHKTSTENKSTTTTTDTTQYEKKELLTEYEKYFYNIINNNFGNDYVIMPQVNLASVVNKIKDFPKQYQNELYRNIDFGIFTKNTLSPLLLIEINDKTHEQKERQDRDKKVRDICYKANIKLITFYSKYDNKPDYVINRIKNELTKK